MVNTIPQSFGKQRVAISKAAAKAGRHADTKNRIIQFLSHPPSHQDPLRVMPVDQLATLSDPDLVHQALQLLTTENFSGSIRLLDGSAVSMRDCILEFVGNSKTREGRELKKQLNERLGEIKALLDGSEVSLYDDFSSCHSHIFWGWSDGTMTMMGDSPRVEGFTTVTAGDGSATLLFAYHTLGILMMISPDDDMVDI